MKKTIILLMMMMASFAVFSQPKKAEQKKETIEAAKDTLTIDVTKVRFVKIGDQVHDLNTEIPLFISFDWAISAYSFFDNAKSGLSKKETEQLQAPVAPYWQYYQRQQQQKK